MKCPTKEQIQEAAKTSCQARLTLVKLFPEAFERPIHIGEIYSWGTANDGGSGLIINNPYNNCYMFINFRTGEIYLTEISRNSIKCDLNRLLKQLHPDLLHNCYRGELRGPKHFSSWCAK